MKISISRRLAFRRVENSAVRTILKIIRNAKDTWNKLNKNKLEIEVFQSCIILKNTAIVQKELPMSTDYIIEQLKDNSKLMKHVYEEILSEHRKGNDEKIFDIIGDKVDTVAGRNFAMILAKLETINPAEIVLMMEAFEENFTADRMTKALHRTERRALITTAASTGAVFAILMNFIVVVVFMDTISILGKGF